MTANIQYDKLIDENTDKSPYSADSWKNGKNMSPNEIMNNIILPPPMTISTEKVSNIDTSPDQTINEANTSFKTGEITLDEEGNLIRKFIEYSGFTRDIVESMDRANILFEDYVNNTVINLGNNREIVFKLEYHPPSITKPNKENILMTPLMALETNSTYSHNIDIIMNIVSNVNGNIQKLGQQKVFSFGKVPTMKGSNMDNVKNKAISNQAKLNMGECPYDAKGTFVVTGNEYMILNQDGLAYDRILVTHEKDMISANYTATKFNYNTEKIKVFKHPKTGDYRVSPYGSKDINKSLNLFQIFRLFSVSDENDILNIILGSANKKYVNNIRNELKSTMFVYGRFTSEDSDYEKLGDLKVVSTQKQENKTKTLYDIEMEKEKNIAELYTRLFPQYNNLNRYREMDTKYVDQYGFELIKDTTTPDMDRYIYKDVKALNVQPDGSTIIDPNTMVFVDSGIIKIMYNGQLSLGDIKIYNGQIYAEVSPNPIQRIVKKTLVMDANIKHQKLKMLSLMVNRLIEVYIGARQADDLNSWSNKTVKTAAHFIHKLLMNEWNGLVESIKSRVETKTDVTLGDINIDVNVTNKFVTSFTTNWNTGDWKKEERVTDLLSRLSLLAVYTYVTRISPKGSRKDTSPGKRGLQATQYGFVGIYDTPEGQNCGMLRSKAIGAWISIFRDPAVIWKIIYISAERNNLLSNVRTSEKNDFLLMNGTIMSYCSGKELYDVLIDLQRKQVIYFDIDILYIENDNTLYIQTTAGRLMRPLLVVNDADDQELLLYDKIKNGELEDTNDFKKILDAGCIDYVSPWKQDSIMLTQSLNDLKSRREFLDQSMKKLARVKEIKEHNDNPMYLSIYSKDQAIFLTHDEYVNEIKNKVNEIQERIDKLTSEIDDYEKNVTVKFDDYNKYVADIDQRIANKLKVNVDELNNYADKERYNYIRDEETRLTSEYSINMDKYIENVDKKIISLEEEIETLNKDKETYMKKMKEDMKPVSNRDIDSTIKKIENEIMKIRRKRKYTHSEINPNSIFGISTSIIPHPDMNQGPRNAYACNMMRQAIGIYLTNARDRVDKTSRSMAWPQVPVYQTQMNKMIGLNDLGSGHMLVLAILSYLNYGEEDAVIFNQAAIQRGLFKKIIRKTITATLDSRTTGTSKYGVSFNDIYTNDIPNKNVRSNIYENLDQDGIVKVGSAVQQGDCLAGIKRTVIEKDSKDDPGVTSHLDKSIYAALGEDGIVEKVIKSNDKTVKIVIRRVVDPVIGDKFATRGAQKRTASIMLKDSQMPYILKNGVRPSAIMNPHAIPSRMTLAQLHEMLTGKAGVIKGERVNATAFNESFDMDKYMQILKEYGYDEWGWEVMSNGMTGERFLARIFVGPVFEQALKHLIEDKGSVSKGNIKQVLSRQPLGNRKKGGGIRYGEMERDVIASHGAAELFRSVYVQSSDKFTCVQCVNCNRISYQDSSERFKCRVCLEDADFGQLDVSFSSLIVANYLASAGINFTQVSKEQSPSANVVYRG